MLQRERDVKQDLRRTGLAETDSAFYSSSSAARLLWCAVPEWNSAHSECCEAQLGHPAGFYWHNGST